MTSVQWRKGPLGQRLITMMSQPNYIEVSFVVVVVVNIVGVFVVVVVVNVVVLSLLVVTDHIMFSCGQQMLI